MRWSLAGKTALVTGCTSGIGLAIADELIALGATVIGAARSAERLNEWAAARATRGIAADVASPADRKRLVGSLDRLDILINNAGTNIRKSATDYSDDEYSRVCQTNMDSVFDISNNRRA